MLMLTTQQNNEELQEVGNFFIQGIITNYQQSYFGSDFVVEIRFLTIANFQTISIDRITS